MFIYAPWMTISNCLQTKTTKKYRAVWCIVIVFQWNRWFFIFYYFVIPDINSLSVEQTLIFNFVITDINSLSVEQTLIFNFVITDINSLSVEQTLIFNFVITDINSLSVEQMLIFLVLCLWLHLFVLHASKYKNLVWIFTI